MHRQHKFCIHEIAAGTPEIHPGDFTIQRPDIRKMSVVASIYGRRCCLELAIIGLHFSLTVVRRAWPGTGAINFAAISDTQIASMQLPLCFGNNVRFVMPTDIAGHGLDLRQHNFFIA